MATMTAQDKTGWILACASGLACVAGSSIICLDLICRQVPRWKHFSIRESTTFLSASLSLSFGVMFYSALYAMLPKAHSYFLSSLSSSTAAYATIGAFLAGVAGLQIVSDLLHHLLPSSIVNCEEHTGSTKKHSESHPERSIEDALESGHHHHRTTETTPLLAPQPPPLTRKPSIKQKITGLVKCNADGTCYGFTDHVCEQKCDPVKILEILDEMDEREAVVVAEASQDGVDVVTEECGHGSENGHRHGAGHSGHEHSHVHTNPDVDTSGHHHVAKNKFLSIGVQTSIAIALHKIPEGFITYATNHANPSLGFTVFLALFIHNIAEGFIMSLPLFLALKSRFKAIICASLLGGLSQPLGAAIAALSMRGGSTGDEEGGVGYGVLFAVTAGIMGSVGVQLFSQAVQLKHGSRVPFVFGFIGMGLLGVSFALTADH